MKDPNLIAVSAQPLPIRLQKHERTAAVHDVIDRVLNGLSLRDAIKETGLTPKIFAMALQEDREAAIAYARAVEIKADLLADEVVQIADSDTDPAKVRNQMTARQWLASKLHSKRYGDRIDLNVTQTIDVGATLAEARARLLPVRDLGQVIDVEPVAAQGLAGDGPSDKESIAPASNPQPDIFS